MFSVLAIGGVGLLLLGGAVWAGRTRRRRARARARYQNAPFPKAWRAVLRRRVPFYARLPEPLRERYHRQIKIFLAGKTFTACGGLRAVNDAMAVTIAGHACVLLLGWDDTACFPTVQSVLVYPDSFAAPVRTFDHDLGAEIVYTEARDGEASPAGSVVLAWRQILQTNALAGNGQNLVIHEFAHHVRPAGAALLAALEAGLRQLRADGTDSVIDTYGAQNAEEFWAVSVEAFFENAPRLRAAHPEFYKALADFFALDPAAW